MTPLIEVAKVGSTVEFTCSSSYKMKWKFENSAENFSIENSLPPNGKMMTPTKRISILQINNVRLDNAGYYVCYGVHRKRGYYENSLKLYVGKNTINS